MPIPELLAKLAGRSNWKSELSGYGHGSLSEADIAYCLSGLHGEYYTYCRIKYLADKQCMPDLIEWVLKSTKDHKYSLEFAMLAVYESINPIKCKLCSGKGEIHSKHGKITSCGSCQGTGQRFISASEKARFIGIKRQVFNRLWSERYQEVFRLVNSLDDHVLRHVNRKLKQPLDLGCAFS